MKLIDKDMTNEEAIRIFQRWIAWDSELQYTDREENIEAAKKLGFHGIVFTLKEEAEVELEKIIELKK